MKPLKILMVGLFAGGVIVLLSSVSLAGDAQDQVKVKMLNDAAIALVKSNPDLAQRLTNFAIEEATEKEEKNDTDDTDDTKETGNMKADEKMKHREEHIKLLRESASALKTTNPELALTLMQMADRSENKMGKI
jgi:hypothetical protein